MAQARNTPAINPNGEKGSITCSTDRENEVGKILIISPVQKKGGKIFQFKHTFEFRRPQSELQPAKLTNHSVHTN